MSIDVNLQALHGFSVAAAVTANNVANMNTPGFKASTTILTSGPADQGVRVGAIERDASPGPYVPSGPIPPDSRLEQPLPGMIEGSNVDVGRQMVDLMLTQRAYEANLTAASVQDQTLGTVLDIRA